MDVQTGVADLRDHASLALVRHCPAVAGAAEARLDNAAGTKIAILPAAHRPSAARPLPMH
jgi:hypothetical protein